MKKDPAAKEVVDASLKLASLCLQFGRTMRVTYHEDGKQLESDTDHTVMLGIMACAFAKEFAPHLDLGKIAQYALVHDLPEVYAGDTSTFGGLTEAQKADKDAREHAAISRIRTEYGSVFPWVADTIEEYETLESPEARFVKVFDKALPKIVHVLNDGVTARELGHTKESTDAFCAEQARQILAGYGHDQPEALAFMDAMRELMLTINYGK